MSFDFNPNVNLSNVQRSAKTCAGGGGNTGYFERGKKKDEEEEILDFSSDKTDSFEYTDLEEEPAPSFVDMLLDGIEKIFNKIKSMFSK